MHEFFHENVRNPAHNRRAGLMRQFSSGQLYSTPKPTVLDRTSKNGKSTTDTKFIK
jgi:hypothetical protein